MHPAAMALHYGQAIFEGLKATNGKTGPLLFRPADNARRLNVSAERMGMPTFPEDLFVEALKRLVGIEKKLDTHANRKRALPAAIYVCR